MQFHQRATEHELAHLFNRALFIWVNSAAGLFGQMAIGVEISGGAFILVGIACIGGFIGSYLGSKKLNNSALRYVLAFVLSLATIKLFFV